MALGGGSKEKKPKAKVTKIVKKKSNCAATTFIPKTVLHDVFPRCRNGNRSDEKTYDPFNDFGQVGLQVVVAIVVFEVAEKVVRLFSIRRQGGGNR